MRWVRSSSVRVAAIQMTSTPDRDANLATADRLVARAAAGGAELVALPEMFPCCGSADDLRAGAEPLDGPSLGWAREAAARHGLWLAAGTIIEQALGAERFSNTATLWSPDGDLAATYRKIHLFDVMVPGATLHESATIAPGDDIVTVDAASVTLGLTICYDLRFPELFRILTLRGADGVLVPSAFTAATGPFHWEVLIRARAIENQTFVVAPDQCGESTPARRWHGDTMVVDAWGTVLARAEAGEAVVAADLDLTAQREIRERLPSVANRRPGAYRWPPGG